MNKTKETMIKKYGSLELYKKHLREVGSKGGKNGVGYEFAHGKVSPKEAGRRGGLAKRGKLLK